MYILLYVTCTMLTMWRILKYLWLNEFSSQSTRAGHLATLVLDHIRRACMNSRTNSSNYGSYIGYAGPDTEMYLGRVHHRRRQKWGARPSGEYMRTSCEEPWSNWLKLMYANIDLLMQKETRRGEPDLLIAHRSPKDSVMDFASYFRSSLSVIAVRQSRINS